MKKVAPLSQQGPTHTALALVKVAFLGSALVGVFLEFNQATYDWDVDHEMYFGQVLWRGELIWTREFHDKLPLLQFLFAIPALFESVTAWRIISLISMLGAAIVVIHFSPLLFGNGVEKAKQTGWLAVSIYLCLCVVMPGGLTHINVVPASAALTALVLLVLFFEQEKTPKQMVALALWIAFLVTVAISVRPYFLFALAPVAIWLSLIFIFRSRRYSRALRFLIVAGLAFSVAAVGFGTNGLPYFLTNETSAFLEGLRFISQRSNPSPALHSFLMQLREGSPRGLIAWFTGAMLLFGMAGTAIFGLTRESGAHFYRLVMLSALSLAGGISSQHWWAHYSNLFSWYFAIVASVGLVWLLERCETTMQSVKRFARVGLVLVSSFFCLLPLAAAGFLTAKAVNSDSTHAETWRLKAIEGYLDERYGREVSFLSPEHMFTHWRLGEPRHGFPHSANTAHIGLGWWESSLETTNFLSPKSTAEYCELLHRSSVDVIFVNPDSDLVRCKAVHGNTGELVLRETISQSGNRLEVWDRFG